MRKGIVYVCINMFDGRRYIGQTIQNFEVRKKRHLQDAFKKNSQLYFHRALRKFGEDNFVWCILEHNISLEELNKKEKFYINKYKTNNHYNGYNMNEGGDSTYNSKLKQEEVIEIKKLLKEDILSMHEISKIFSVDVSSISDINCGDTHFDDDETYPIRYTKYSNEISRDTVYNIYDMLKLGKKFSTISAMYGISTTSVSKINKGEVHRYLDDSCYPIIEKSFTYTDDVTIKRIVELLKTTNLTHQKIGDELGVSREIVKNINLGYNNVNILNDLGCFDFPIRKNILNDEDFKNKISLVAFEIKNSHKPLTQISKDLNINVNTVKNLNRGISFKKILGELGYTTFPIRNKIK